jgi:hypothetical protein
MTMTDPNAAGTAAVGRDWRLGFSLGLTAVWLSLGFLYISSVVGWLPFVRQSAPALGGFLEGAFAPLAFLWLVVGFFLQQKQLSENTAAIEKQYQVMQRTAEQAEIQSRAIAANEMHARQDTFIEVAKLVGNQLGVIAGYQWMSSQGQETNEAMANLWSQLGSGDETVFSRLLIAMVFRGNDDAAELFWSTPVRTRHSEDFIRTFERLAAEARACDPQGMLEDALRADAHGRTHRFMMESRPGSSPARA